MKFYTSVNRKGNKLYERGYENGRAFQREIVYKPYLFINTPSDTGYRTIFGDNVGKIMFENMYEARAYMERHKELVGHNIYGLTDYEFQYIYENYPKSFPFDYNLINVINLDIETDSSDGFPNIDTADKEINAITLANRDKTYSFGFFPYQVKDAEKQIYVQCDDERDLLIKFIRIWTRSDWKPDILTGWNIELFDVPYIVNRIRRVLGDNYVDKLSPFGFVKPREIEQLHGKIGKTYTISGISVIDYFVAYRKFAMGERESHRLDFIAEYELGEKKVDYRALGYLSLDDLYKRNFKLYMDYNIQDAVLIEKLENKLHYIEQVVNIAYIERVNFENTLSTVKPWDIIVHNYLMDNNIVIPQIDRSEKHEYVIEGGYVKEPKPGLYRNVISVDFTSLYPSIAMQYNISPDTFVKQFPFRKEKIVSQIEKLMNGDNTALTAELVRRDMCMTANGCLFKRDKRGFIPSLMKEFFDERVRVRKLEAEAESKYESTKNDDDRNVFLKHKNLQTAFKLINNSGYGAIANKHFRWFATYLAEGITLSGQMTTKYVEQEVNIFLNEQFGTVGEVYVIYCDTDSAYITLDALVKDKGLDTAASVKALVEYSRTILCPFIDSVCERLAKRLNAFEMKTSMKLEKVCDKVFFIRKKRYALNTLYKEGQFYEKGKLNVTGLETVRSGVPKKCRKALEECFKLIFKDDRQGLIKFVEDFRQEFFNFTFEEIGKPSSVKGLAEYYDAVNLCRKATPIHVRASLVYNEFLKRNKLTDKYSLILDHDKIRYCYLRLPNPTFQNVIAIKDEIPNELNVAEFMDYELQYSKSFLEPLKTVCEIVGFDTRKIYTLEELYGD